jgi:hypothetical protein
MGIEVLIVETPPASLAPLDRLSGEFDLVTALSVGARRPGLDDLLKRCRNCSERVGVQADLGDWLRQGANPVRMVRKADRRLLVLDFRDLDRRDTRGRDVAWGTGAGQCREVLRELQRRATPPVMLGLPAGSALDTPAAQVSQSKRFFDSVSLELAPGTHAP